MAKTTPQEKRSKRRAVSSRRQRLEKHALGLANQCPIGPLNPINCPLHGLRLQPMRSRVRWIRGLKVAELEYLAAYHACCALRKTVAC